MTKAVLISITAVAAALVAGGCGSDKGGKGGGTGGVNLINLGPGATGNVAATSTPNGMQQLTAAQAATLLDPAGACEGWVGEPEGGAAVVEFVVDTTESMAERTASTGNQTKWQVMQDVLPQALAGLPATWEIGMSFYCKNDPATTGNCFQGHQQVPIALHDAAQQTALADAIAARGNCSLTPSQAAWTFGLDTVQATPPGSRYIVLVTDGVPTVNSDGCTNGSGNPSISQAEYDQFIQAVTSQTAATGVKTFVVGVPGSEDPQGAPYDPMYELSLLAVAGGTALPNCTSSAGTSNGNQVNPRGTYCHYDMTQAADFATGLRDTISTIAGGIVSCDYTVPPAPTGQVIDTNKVNMIYEDGAGNAYLVLPNGDATCDRGWHYTDATKTAIHVCDITCNEVQANSLARITLMFGCTAGDIPVY